MRTALFSAIKTAEDGQLLAALPFLGRSVLEWQFDCAVALGAERIICLSSAHVGQPLDLQHRAEKLGMDFHLISNPIAMAGLVAADHEILLFADAVKFDPKAIPQPLHEKRGILAVSRSVGEVAEFERIDAENCWAGLLMAKGDVVSHLADLPADSDAASLILRLALQARTPLVPLPPEVVETGEILNVTNPAVIAQREDQAFAGAIPRSSWAGVGQAMATILVKSTGPRIIPQGLTFALALAIVISLAALALATAGIATVAMLCLVLAAFFAAITSVIFEVRRKFFDSERRALQPSYIKGLIDASIIASIVLPIMFDNDFATLALAPIALGAIRVAEGTSALREHHNTHAFVADRVVLVAGLAVAVALNLALIACAAIAICAITYAIIFSPRRSIRQA